MAQSRLRAEFHPEKVILNFGSDSKWCKDVVKRINQDLHMTGCYDELHFKGGYIPLFVSEFTKDHANIPPAVRIEDREEVERAKKAEEELRAKAEAKAKGEEFPVVHRDDDAEDEVKEDGRVSYLHSRLNLPAVFIRSICQHADMRLLTIDKSTRLTTGVSTYIFEAR